RAGRLDEAIAVWQDVVRQSPADTTARLSLARLYQRTEQLERALATVLDAVDVAPSLKTYLTAAQALDDLAEVLPEPDSNRAVRVALVGNATLDHLQAYVKVECYGGGLRPSIYQGGFDQYTQDMRNPGSDLYAFRPDVLICAVHPSRLFPALHHDPSSLSTEERRDEIERGLRNVQHLLDAFSANSSAMVLLHTWPVPEPPALGILDPRAEVAQVAPSAETTARLAELARSRYKNVFIVDEERVQSRAGKRTTTDPRLWFSARLPWSEPALAGLAGEYLRYLRPLRGLSRKCIVLDLDNTLWGGVIGEDGLAGIQLGADAPGNAFVAFQRELEKLWRRGILLAVCSKNNPEDAQLAMDTHPDMVLRGSHFAAQRINWQPKALNIREIAAELNIGLDSLVFLDDNPAERAQVRAELPQVLVPDLPIDPADYPACLLELGVFDTLALTAEDRQRNQQYADQKARRAAEAATASGGSVDDYLADLNVVVEIESANEMTLARIAQLTNKTNQFNMTTRRY